ncbi:hypothetical protein HLV35_05285 [Eggerthellaceae bacterium zg-997]|nr:hypothetical protein [Eggerthellaceae bacterium zg-997]
MPCENSARKRSKTMAFRCSPEERKLICDMAAWSGMSKQDYIIAKLSDTKVEVRPSVSVQKALRDSMAELTEEARLAASYGEPSESLQQRIKLVMEFFLALGEPVDALLGGMSQTGTSPATNESVESETDDDTSIFELGRVSGRSLGGAAHYTLY